LGPVLSEQAGRCAAPAPAPSSGDALGRALDVVAQAVHLVREGIDGARADQHPSLFQQELGNVLGQAAPGRGGMRHDRARPARQSIGGDRPEQAFEVVLGIPAQPFRELGNRVGELGIAVDAHIGKRAVAVLQDQRQVAGFDVDGHVRHVFIAGHLEHPVARHAHAQAHVAHVDTGDLAGLAHQGIARPGFLGQQVIDGRYA
jgi:hypothetical protein